MSIEKVAVIGAGVMGSGIAAQIANAGVSVVLLDIVPKDAGGKKAVFEGEAKMETVVVATLKYYAEDAGKSKEEIEAITEPETKLTFVASGVEIEE